MHSLVEGILYMAGVYLFLILPLHRRQERKYKEQAFSASPNLLKTRRPLYLVCLSCLLVTLFLLAKLAQTFQLHLTRKIVRNIKPPCPGRLLHHRHLQIQLIPVKRVKQAGKAGKSRS